MKKLSIITALMGTMAIAGCSINPANYATLPVNVSTAQGTVTCQLYTEDIVVWDKAIDAPAGMSISTADKICKQEGHRRKAAS